MNLTLKHAVAAIILGLSFATPVAAGALEDANAHRNHLRQKSLNLVGASSV